MGVFAAASCVGLWAAVVDTPDFTSEVALMIGLGVGIDYAVFIVTRYRRALAEGRTPEESIIEAMSTAGRAVVFAGAIVMVSLLGMTLMGMSMFNGLALGSATAVLVAVLAAVSAASRAAVAALERSLAWVDGVAQVLPAVASPNGSATQITVIPTRRTGDNSSAVVEGLASTARVITAAAAIMVMVFGAFVFNDVRSLKLIGFGLAAAVLIDATIVRMLLVPATMELLGARNWWIPRWLDRVLPHVHIDDHAPVTVPDADQMTVTPDRVLVGV